MNLTLDKHSIQRAADLLIDARITGKPISGLPTTCTPASAQDAYAIQDAVMASLGPIAGWKVGAKGPALEPNCAPIFASTVYESPRALDRQASRLRGVEAEIAVYLREDLPYRDKPYSQRELAKAIGAVVPAIEIVESRYINMQSQSALCLLADGLSNAGLVFGQPTTVPLPMDPSLQHAEIFFNALRVGGGYGGNAAGNLLRLLAWLANHSGLRAGGLRAGQYVTTGSWTGLLFAQPDTRVSALIKDLGNVEVTFA
jgi:2-keto-4-pentenoate hydratase